jgi:multiple sugar transport system ATP-binding protein
MNLFDLKCDGRTALLGGYRIPLPASMGFVSRVTLGIRPEHVELVGSALNGGTTNQTVQGKVVLVENLGMSDLVSLKVQGAESLTLRALVPSDRPWRQETITVMLPSEHIHWFEAETGNRLADEPSRLPTEQIRESGIR